MNKGRKLLVFIILFIGMFLFPYIPLELFHINLNNLSEKMRVLYNFICNIVYILIVLAIYRKQNTDELKDYRKKFKEYFKLSISYYIIGFILMYISNFLITTFFNMANANKLHHC